MNILLIEDDIDDVELLQHALSSRAVEYRMHAINDGSKASAHLQSSADVPDVIVLDLNLPKKHGKELIKEIKSAGKFRSVPLLVLTTSSAKEDISYAYEHGADKYLIKPTHIDQINELVQTIVSLGSRKPGDLDN